MGWPDAGDLLAGPRGRRLCWSLLDLGGYPGWTRVWAGAHPGDLTSLLGELDDCVARTDLDATVTQASELALLAALAEPVGRAAYWQEPDEGAGRAAAGGPRGNRRAGRAVVAEPYRTGPPAVRGVDRRTRLLTPAGRRRRGACRLARRHGPRRAVGAGPAG